MSENNKKRNAKPKSSPALIRAVVYDAKHSDLTLVQIARKHNIASISTVHRWVKQFSSDFEPMEVNGTSSGKKEAQPSQPSGLPADSSAAQKELMAALEEARMKIICLETMIDIAEKELNVNIRKKSGTKQ